MLSRGKKIIIIGGVLVVLVVVVVLLLYFMKSAEIETGQPGETIDETGPAPIEEITYQLPALTTAEKDRAEIHNLAMVFTERFGTYSNQGDFEQIDGLDGVMTDTFARWVATNYKKQLENRYNGTTYASVQTEALAVEFDNVSATNATVVVSTRQMLKNGGDPLVTDPKLELRLVKNTTDWQIDGAFWQTQ